MPGYRVGLTIAPVMPVPQWQEAYGALLDDVAAALAGVDDLDLTAEVITHRFTPNSKEVLLGWYPRTQLEMDEDQRSAKRSKFGGVKYVYPKVTMTEMRTWFVREITAPAAGGSAFSTGPDPGARTPTEMSGGPQAAAGEQRAGLVPALQPRVEPVRPNRRFASGASPVSGRADRPPQRRSARLAPGSGRERAASRRPAAVPPAPRNRGRRAPAPPPDPFDAAP